MTPEVPASSESCWNLLQAASGSDVLIIRLVCLPALKRYPLRIAVFLERLPLLFVAVATLHRELGRKGVLWANIFLVS